MVRVIKLWIQQCHFDILKIYKIDTEILNSYEPYLHFLFSSLWDQWGINEACNVKYKVIYSMHNNIT